MKPKILVYKTLNAEQLERLNEHFQVQQLSSQEASNPAFFNAALEDAEGILGSSVPMPASRLKLAKRLKVASTISVGTDQFDLAHLSERGIPLMHTPGVLDETTADTLFTLIMCAARRAVELANYVKEGRWQQSIGAELFGTDVHGKTLGIIGMGRIGYALAKRAHLGFDMKIQYHNRRRHEEAEKAYNAQFMALDELLKSADFICVMTPLTPQTEGLIGAKEFALMKPSAIFINGSRGKVINESALLKALQEKTIRAAGLDVFEIEPLPLNSPLRHLDNLVTFPHIGSATMETRERMTQCAIDNLIQAFQGDLSQHCANLADLPSSDS
ncbi:2-hydroxyacid dehydrogenase [Marinomonas epiphytica]